MSKPRCSSRTLFYVLSTIWLSFPPLVSAAAVDLMYEWSDIREYVSINDAGQIAFIGEKPEGTAVFVADDLSRASVVSFAPNSERDYGRVASLNNPVDVNGRAQAVAREQRRGGSFLIRRWVSDDNATIVATSIDDIFDPLGLRDPAGYDAFASFTDINDNNEVVYIGLDTDIASITRLHIRRSLADADKTIELGDFPSSAGLRPQISNETEVVFSSPSRKSIIKSHRRKASLGRIAGGQEGFTTVGLSPGITDDGTAVAFYAEGTEGPAIWLSVLKVHGEPDAQKPDSSGLADWQLIQVAGLPDELGEGIRLQHFRTESRIGVGGKKAKGVGDTAVYHLTYIAENTATGRETLWRSRVMLRAEPPMIPERLGQYTVTVLTAPQKVAEIGEELTVNTASGSATRTIEAFQVYDPINNRGDIGFWAQFASGKHAVLRARSEPFKVVNIVTHGFGREFDDPALGYVTEIFPDFLDQFSELGKNLEYIPRPGSELDKRVVSYVASWNSSQGWGQGLVNIAMSSIFQGLSLGATDVKKKALEIASDTALAMGLAYVKQAGVIAEEAAQKIVDDVLQTHLLEDPQLSQNGDQIIHLIGHSRGAAVNARVAQLLIAKGYKINQYTALDGYSVDWPHGSGFLGDIDIVGTLTNPIVQPQVSRLVNYLVESGLEQKLPDIIPPYLSLAADVLLSSKVDDFSPEIKQLFTDENLFGWKAPLRDGFENKFIFGINEHSDHLNVVELYTYSNDRPAPNNYILDNFVGENRDNGLPSAQLQLMPFSQAVAGGIPASAINRPTANATAARGNFIDGSFEELGALQAQISTVTFPETGDGLVDAWIALIQEPLSILSTYWSVRGDLQLVTEDDDAKVEMIQTAYTALGQLVHVDSTSGFLHFDLSVIAAGPDDRLEAFLNGQLVTSLFLEGLADGHYAIPVSQFAGQSGEMTFVLAGPESVPAIIRLDDITLEGSEQSSSLRVFDGDVEVVSGSRLNLGTITQDTGPIRHTLTVRNISGSSLAIQGLTISGTGYTVSGGGSDPIPPDGEVEIIVSLSDQVSGQNLTGILTISTVNSSIQLFLVGNVTQTPLVVAITPLDLTPTGQAQVAIDFSVPMDPTTAANIVYYTFSRDNDGELEIASGTYSDEGTLHRTVLTLAPGVILHPGEYRIQVNASRVTSIDGTPMAPRQDDLLVHVQREHTIVRVRYDPNGAPDPWITDELIRFPFGPPEKLIASDFNQDGSIDLVTLSSGDAELAYWPGRGNQRFAAVVSIPLEAPAYHLATVDWNGDGLLDLATFGFLQEPVNGVYDMHEILINDGEGGFTAAAETPILVDTNFDALAYADMTGDGELNIIQTRFEKLKIIGRDQFLGFGVIEEIDVVGNDFITEIDIADFNHDNRLDLLLEGRQYLENTDTGFAAPVTVDYDVIRGGPTTVADVTGDGELDLVILHDLYSNIAGRDEGNVITVVEGDGQGGFTERPFQKLNNLRGLSLLAAGDLNNDGELDLVLRAVPFPGFNPFEERSVWVFHGDGAGHFTPATEAPIPPGGTDKNGLTSTSLVDVNNDGFLDAMFGTMNSGAIRVMLNDGTGTLVASPLPEPGIPTKTDPSNIEEGGFVVADVNLDGRRDLVRAALGVEIYVADSQGALTLVQSIQPFSSGYDEIAWIRVADLNHDQFPDIMAGVRNGPAAALLGQGNGMFIIAPGSPFTEGEEGIAKGDIVDVNLDGHPDLIAILHGKDCNSSYCTLTADAFGVFFGDGTGQFVFNLNTRIQPGFELEELMITADFNLDGVPDVLASPPFYRSDDAQIYIGTGNGTFSPGQKLDAVGVVKGIRHEEDYNGDGYLDLLVFGGLSLKFYLGDGTGQFVADPSRTITLDSDQRGVNTLRSGDFNGDGVLDLAGAYWDNYYPLANDIFVLFGNGKGGFEEAQQIVVASRQSEVGAEADFLEIAQRDQVVEIGRFTVDVAPSLVTLNVTPAGTGIGTVTSEPSGIRCRVDCTEQFTIGTSVILTASPVVGSIFSGWSGGGCSGTDSCTVTLSTDTTVTATFEPQPVTLTVATIGAGTGTVTSVPAGIACGADCSEIFPPGTTVTLSVVPEQGSIFSGWSGGCSGTDSCTVTLTTDTTVTVEIEAQECISDGDVNADGDITPADSLLAFKHFLGFVDSLLDACQQAHANVQEPTSTGITPADALCIFQQYLGLPSCIDG